MARPRPTFESGTPLPKNVYYAPRDNTGLKFRYKRPDDSYKMFTVDVNESIEEQVFEIAAICEKEYSQSTIKEVREARAAKAKNKENRDDTVFSFWVEQYLNSMTQSEVYRRNVRGGIYKHFKSLMQQQVVEITDTDLYGCWIKMSYSTQARLRSNLVRLIQPIIRMKMFPLVDQSNPFRPAGHGGFEYHRPKQKKRNILHYSVFNKIKSNASEKGYQFLVDAMDISFLTYLRISDVLSLEFTDIEDNCLKKFISKTEGRTTTLPVEHSFPLDIHQGLAAIIARSKSSANECPFIVHHNEYKQNRKSEVKVHPNQVLPNFINKKWNECMEGIEEVSHLAQSERPSFHEIRALRKSIDDSHRDIKDISLDLAHTSTKVTEGFYDTHRTHIEHQVTYAPAVEVAH